MGFLEYGKTTYESLEDSQQQGPDTGFQMVKKNEHSALILFQTAMSENN